MSYSFKKIIHLSLLLSFILIILDVRSVSIRKRKGLLGTNTAGQERTLAEDKSHQDKSNHNSISSPPNNQTPKVTFDLNELSEEALLEKKRKRWTDWYNRQKEIRKKILSGEKVDSVTKRKVEKFFEKHNERNRKRLRNRTQRFRDNTFTESDIKAKENEKNRNNQWKESHKERWDELQKEAQRRRKKERLQKKLAKKSIPSP